jgi:2-aminoadipate transaminase
VQLKQAADLHTNRVSQAIVLHFLNAPDRAERMQRLVDGYKTKRDRFADLMTRHLGNRAQWTLPPGGLFFWATLAPEMDAQRLLTAAAAKGVLFTPGSHFHANADESDDIAQRTLRLNFSHADPEATDKGLAILGALLRA